MRKCKLFTALLLGMLLVNSTGCAKETIVINQAENVTVSEGKVSIPTDAVSKSYTWEELCQYFGKDVSFVSLPEGFEDKVKEQNFEIYVDEHNNIVYDSVELYYPGKEDQYIRLKVAKDRLPVADEVYTGGEASVIEGQEIQIYQAEDVYHVAFIKDGVGYDLTTKGISQDELLKLLKEKINKE